MVALISLSGKSVSGENQIFERKSKAEFSGTRESGGPHSAMQTLLAPHRENKEMGIIYFYSGLRRGKKNEKSTRFDFIQYPEAYSVAKIYSKRQLLHFSGTLNTG